MGGGLKFANCQHSLKFVEFQLIFPGITTATFARNVKLHLIIRLTQQFFRERQMTMGGRTE